MSKGSLSVREDQQAPARLMFGRRVWSAEAGYDLVAEAYDRWHWTEFWCRNERPCILDTVRAHHPLRRSLDIGCGTGAYCLALAESGAVVGVDPSRRMLEIARTRIDSRVDLVRGTTSSIPVPNAFSDLCLSARSLCHEGDLEAAAGEIARVVALDGIWIISELHPEHTYPRTRIPLNGEDVHIETFKRSPEDILQAAARSKFWTLQSLREFRWHDLNWKPESRAFDALDRTAKRRIFYVMVLRRIGTD